MATLSTQEQWLNSISERLKDVLFDFQKPLPTGVTAREKAETEDELRAISTTSETSPEVLDYLAHWGIPVLQSYVADNSSAFPETLDYLFQELKDYSEFHVATILSSNPSISKELLETLVNMGDLAVDFGLTSNPSTPVATLVTLYKKHRNFSELELAYSLACNKNLPLWCLQELAQGGALERRGVARNQRATPELLEQLSKDSVSGVQENCGKNPNTLPETLSRLSLSSERRVRQAVAFNLNTPVATLATLSGDRDPQVRAYVARNRNTPLEILEKLARDPVADVRSWVAIRAKEFGDPYLFALATAERTTP